MEREKRVKGRRISKKEVMIRRERRKWRRGGKGEGITMIRGVEKDYGMRK